MIADNAFVDGLLDVQTQLTQGAFLQGLGAVELDILDTTVSSPRYLVVAAEIVRN